MKLAHDFYKPLAIGAPEPWRELPVRLTQAVQVMIQNKIISRVLAGKQAPKPALPFRLLTRFPFLRRMPARLRGQNESSFRQVGLPRDGLHLRGGQTVSLQHDREGVAGQCVVGEDVNPSQAKAPLVLSHGHG